MTARAAWAWAWAWARAGAGGDVATGEAAATGASSSIGGGATPSCVAIIERGFGVGVLRSTGIAGGVWRRVGLGTPLAAAGSDATFCVVASTGRAVTGVATVGVATVGVATVGVATVGVATVDVATAGVPVLAGGTCAGVFERVASSRGILVPDGRAPPVGRGTPARGTPPDAGVG